MELKTRIITTTLRMMMQIGVSSMTMDAIARSCGISKRTLYEQFPDKLTLITEALHHDGQLKHDRLEKIFNNSENRLDALLNVYTEIRKQVSHTSFAILQLHSFAQFYAHDLLLVLQSLKGQLKNEWTPCNKKKESYSKK